MGLPISEKTYAYGVAYERVRQSTGNIINPRFRILLASEEFLDKVRWGGVLSSVIAQSKRPPADGSNRPPHPQIDVSFRYHTNAWRTSCQTGHGMQTRLPLSNNAGKIFRPLQRRMSLLVGLRCLPEEPQYDDALWKVARTAQNPREAGRRYWCQAQATVTRLRYQCLGLKRRH